MEITQYILSMESADEQDRYLLEMLDPSNRSHQSLVLEFKDRREQIEGERLGLLGKGDDSTGLFAESGVRVYKKRAEEEDFVVGKKKEKQRSPEKDGVGVEQKTAGKVSISPDSKKPKSKFVSMYSKDGQSKDSILLSGRHLCECLASKHNLINNCIKCGKIVCAQEGSGPCLFCGNLVCTKEEQEVLNRGSKKSDALRKKLLGDAAFQPDSLSKAEQHKNRLLEFDRDCEQRTKVIDDESDYFSVDADKWLTQEQRKKLREREEELRDKRHGSRKDRKITFDFAGRRVVEEDSGMSTYDPSKDEVVKKIMQSKNSNEADIFVEAQRKTLTDGDGLVNPFISVNRPMLVETSVAHKPKQPSYVEAARSSRLQDRELQQMSDDGLCLSMHQPYASLLVAGIKKHEGRTWYSAVRGRLWIHAAAKVPSEEEVEEVKAFYRMYYGDAKVSFPTAFPVGCLLGCVDVEDCLAQEEYRECFPDGESVSPYVFVCSNPQELLVKFPMAGKHKIYKLDSSIHQVAKKSAKKSVM